MVSTDCVRPSATSFAAPVLLSKLATNWWRFAMSHPATACPVCQAHTIVLTATLKHGRDVDMYRCTTCGTHFSVERETAARTH